MVDPEGIGVIPRLGVEPRVSYYGGAGDSKHPSSGWAHFHTPRIDPGGVGASDPPRSLGFKMGNQLDCFIALFLPLEFLLVIFFLNLAWLLKV